MIERLTNFKKYYQSAKITNIVYNNLLKFFDTIITEKFASKDANELYFVANTPQEAIEYLKNYNENNYSMTKENLYQRN
jgi:predicted Rossmann-fold nucleotide-binding protein